MLHKIRARAASDEGFTLIELLVVILIIGILAAIALPSFLNQREKAQDAEAKSGVRTAQTAMETFYTDQNPATYNATPANLITIESALANATGLAASGTATTFTVSVDSDTGTTFTISRAANGVVSRTCDDPGNGGCPSNSSW